MFNNKRIKELEERIADLERPYLYDIGKKVQFRIRNHCCKKEFKGTIVSRSFYYKYGRRINEYIICYNDNCSTKVEQFYIDKLIK